MNQFFHADCLDILKNFPDNSIDAIVTDPPYFKVKKEQWDRQWDTAQGFLDWLDTIAEQWQRILKPNGSLYCFASPQMAARVEVKLSERFNILTNIRWYKTNGNRNWSVNKEAVRAFLPNTESIIFCEHYGSDNIAKGEAGYGAKCDELRGFIFAPIADYLKKERDSAGWGNEEAKIAVGHSPRSGCHWFDRSQWNLPTKEIYETWQQKAKGYFARPYEDLRREYEDLRRPFSLTADVPYTDVWSFPTVSFYQGKHPCEKPLDLIKHIIKTSTRENQIILDCFAGSFTTAISCLELNRKYICIEKDKKYFELGKKRIAKWHEENKQKDLFPYN